MPSYPCYALSRASVVWVPFLVVDRSCRTMSATAITAGIKTCPARKYMSLRDAK